MADAEHRIAEFIKIGAPGDKMPAVCQWALRCHEAGKTAAVRVATLKEAEQLDDLLWTFSDRAFIPHAIASQAKEPVLESVLIYCEGEAPGEADLLIHAAGGEPDSALTNFPRVLDFAEVYDEAAREAGRRRFAACREAGYRMRYIDKAG